MYEKSNEERHDEAAYMLRCFFDALYAYLRAFPVLYWYDTWSPSLESMAMEQYFPTLLLVSIEEVDQEPDAFVA